MSKAAPKQDETIRLLNSLIEVSRDGEKGFTEAAGRIERADLRQFCLDQSSVRAQFVSELQQIVRFLGGTPVESGSLAGAAHRVWIQLKSTVSGDDRAIIAACESGEDSALRYYREALEVNLPADVRPVVEQQYQSIQRSHDLIRTLRESLASSDF